MSDSTPPIGPGDGDPDEPNPFAGVPIFGDLMKLFGQQQPGPMSWDTARQFALSIATEGRPEANIDPVTRLGIEELARVAELQVANATGLEVSQTGQGITIAPVTRALWAQQTLEAYRPLFDVLAASLDQQPGDEAAPDPADPFGFLAPLMRAIGPMMLGLTAGSMVGHLAQRSFGQYDLPIPRPPGDRLLIVVPNIDAFGGDWSLPLDDLRLWVCLNEVTHHAVLGVPHVRERLDTLLRDYLARFEPDPGRLDLLGDFENLDASGPEAFQSLMADPEMVLGALQSPAQRELLPHLEAAVAVVVGYVDHVMDRIGTGLVGQYAMITEAVRRRRVEAAPHDRFVERLFGLELTQAQYDRGTAFVNGVLERAGDDGLRRLWASPRELPTPAEVDAPGLWLARIDLPD
ncbi:MAG: zinc-dependent metalloprotease [Acidimicrobiales bacterium]|nr:zinc-dependent metalloprotease [Acidimicrobiales bacterium]